MKSIYDRLNLNPNKGQKDAIESTEGPVILIAGPGSGKTFCLVLRVINLLLNNKIASKDILLCTFTEKAALQLKTRISNVVDSLGIKVDTSDITVSTIHGLCNMLLSDYIEYSEVDKEYEVLDDLTQRLFIYDNFADIVPGIFIDATNKFYGKWLGKWNTIENICKYFNKFTEELIEVNDLLGDDNVLLQQLGLSYMKYMQLLKDKNYVDFAFLQYFLYKLLNQQDVQDKLKDRFKYIMVDEYQDTNYVQEKIIFALSERTENLCVVGDEDQALYRFRGATVRNLLEFPLRFNNCKKIVLDVNYRSQHQIVNFYNEFMSGINWGNSRFDKYIRPSDENLLLNYPSTFKINGEDKDDEAEQLAELILYLKRNNIINDYSEIALLLSSVREENSFPYINTFNRKGIPTYCPRAKMFFKYDEIKLVIGAIKIILDYQYELDDSPFDSINDWNKYLEEIEFFIEVDIREKFPQLYIWIIEVKQYFKHIVEKNQNSDKTLLDILYELLQYEPFNSHLLTDGVEKYNLAILSDLISKFNKFYVKKGSIITAKNINYMRNMLFRSFLYILYRNGMDEYEDSEHIVKKGAVQIMTIHQSKGLEFPITIVGSIDKKAQSAGGPDKELQHLYQREAFEDIKKITDFDYMRKYYVAFSRAKNLLVLTSVNNKSNPRLKKMYSNLPELCQISRDEWKNITIKPEHDSLNKKQFSLTSHILVYDTCPKQYELYKDVGFIPSRTGGALFGSLVHQTIEDIHKHILKKDPRSITQEVIDKYFYRNYRNLEEHLQHALNVDNIEAAKNQVINYYNNNKSIIPRVKETEVSLTVEKDNYYLNGKIDVIVGEDGGYELWDFKSQSKTEFAGVIDKYRMQMATYVDLIEKKLGINVDRTFIYWTSEENINKAKMPVNVSSNDVSRAEKHFDDVVNNILTKNYKIVSKPNKKTCRECDFRYQCNERNC